MDLATIVGMATGLLIIAYAIISGGSLVDFVSIPSVLVTLGGTLVATVISYPLPKLRALLQLARTMLKPRAEDVSELVDTLTGYAVIARREGILALEGMEGTETDPFLHKALHLAVDGTDVDVIRAVLETDLAFLEERHKAAAGLFEAIATYAPAFGMIGSLIGLIQLLKRLDGGGIGPAISLALLSTLYGVLLANLVCLPVAAKLRTHSGDEILRKEVVIEGILAIAAGEAPTIVEERLKSFLSAAPQPGGGRRLNRPDAYEGEEEG